MKFSTESETLSADSASWMERQKCTSFDEEEKTKTASISGQTREENTVEIGGLAECQDRIEENRTKQNRTE